VTAIDSYGYYKSKTLKVKYVYSSVIINNTMYENTRTLDIIAKNVVKGEKIQVKFNGTLYIHKVKKDAKSYNIKLNIGSHGAGSNIILTLNDKFNRKRSSTNQSIQKPPSSYGTPPRYHVIIIW